jgi:hypothetical protein
VREGRLRFRSIHWLFASPPTVLGRKRPVTSSGPGCFCRASCSRGPVEAADYYCCSLAAGNPESEVGLWAAEAMRPVRHPSFGSRSALFPRQLFGPWPDRCRRRQRPRSCRRTDRTPRLLTGSAVRLQQVELLVSKGARIESTRRAHAQQRKRARSGGSAPYRAARRVRRSSQPLSTLRVPSDGSRSVVQPPFLAT